MRESFVARPVSAVPVGGAPSASLHRAFLSFVVVGVIATGVQYVWLLLLVSTFGIAPTPASSSGFAVSALVNYALNRTLTFASGRAHRQAIPRFLVVALSGLAINTLLVWWLTERVHVQFMLAQIFTTGAVVLWNFGLHRHWTFAERR